MKESTPRNWTPDNILNDIRKKLINSGEYTYIIMGKPGPTGKTWLYNKLRQYGYNAIELTESICFFVDYSDRMNHYIFDNEHHVVTIILNKPLDPVKEMTLEEIEAKLGHKVKIVNKEFIPIKNSETCKKCKYYVFGWKGCGLGNCGTCALRDSDGICKCNKLRSGDPCPYFEEVPDNE